MVNHLSCIEGKRVVKTFTAVHKILRYLLIYLKYLLSTYSKIKISLFEDVVFDKSFELTKCKFKSRSFIMTDIVKTIYLTYLVLDILVLYNLS